MPSRSVLALLVVTGCGTSITSTMLDPSPKPLTSRPADSVEIFASGPPQRPYVDVAYLEAEQQSDMSIDGTRAFIRKLREHAAEMGCDGVVLGAETNRPAVSTGDIAYIVLDALSKKPVEPPDNYGEPANLRGLLATCIVYVPEPGELEANATIASTAYEACVQQRLVTLRAVQRLTTAESRGRLLRTLPTCIKPVS